MVQERGGNGGDGFSISPTERGEIFRCFGYVKDFDHTDNSKITAVCRVTMATVKQSVVSFNAVTIRVT